MNNERRTGAHAINVVEGEQTEKRREEMEYEHQVYKQIYKN